MTTKPEDMTHDDLVDYARAWLSRPSHSSMRNGWVNNRGACPLIITDMTSAARETPDAIGWHAGRSTLIECKTSRADFKADQKKVPRRIPDSGVTDTP